jgi:pimeloyl-ACP methyl ester carboxylesterase
MFRGTTLSVGVEAAALLGEFEPEPLCPGITVPALFVHGADDDVIPVAVSERCADLAPAGRFQALADCGHLAVIDQRQAFHDALAKFLGEPS